MGYPGWHLTYLPSTARESGADGFDHSICRRRFRTSITKVYGHFLWGEGWATFPARQRLAYRVLFYQSRERIFLPSQPQQVLMFFAAFLVHQEVHP